MKDDGPAFPSHGAVLGFPLLCSRRRYARRKRLGGMSIHERLLAWGRWVRVRQRQGRCGSIEHRYKLRRIDDTPYGYDEWATTAPTVPLSPLDPGAALQVEKIMRRLPKKHRLALKFEYVERMPWKMSCKRLGLGYDRWGQHLSKAQQMVENLLTRLEKHARIGAQLDVPAHAETLALDAPMGVCGAACG